MDGAKALGAFFGRFLSENIQQAHGNPPVLLNYNTYFDDSCIGLQKLHFVYMIAFEVCNLLLCAIAHIFISDYSENR